jgi:hypothetical protein
VGTPDIGSILRLTSELEKTKSAQQHREQVHGTIKIPVHEFFFPISNKSDGLVVAV